MASVSDLVSWCLYLGVACLVNIGKCDKATPKYYSHTMGPDFSPESYLATLSDKCNQAFRTHVAYCDPMYEVFNTAKQYCRIYSKATPTYDCFHGAPECQNDEDGDVYYRLRHEVCDKEEVHRLSRHFSSQCYAQFQGCDQQLGSDLHCNQPRRITEFHQCLFGVSVHDPDVCRNHIDRNVFLRMRKAICDSTTDSGAAAVGVNSVGGVSLLLVFSLCLVVRELLGL